ncbi:MULTISPECIES: DUF2281 domain-containing protein [Halomonadaceae]|uniref:DUF2281 domain-containing protein n=1 Tax=Halomonadaceae TaxID=28256 RepID=UPI0015998A6C|nr:MULTISPECIES: DUF2281 domain-containing protein [Halomonas]QJQ96052.1 DUF2281 domain-containing protein [Halomonas sp. PA5]
MLSAEQIAMEISQLPESLQREVLDFAHFLKHKAEGEELGNLMLAQEKSLQHEWDNHDDEVWNDVPVR